MGTIRVSVKPELFRWARQRARQEREDLERAFPKLRKWELGQAEPTLKQLEAFARRTHAPIGYFFLDEPPEEPLPIPDFRTNRSEGVARPSVDLLDTIYACQNRQSWYREYVELSGQAAPSVVGSVVLGEDVPTAARKIREALGVDVNERRVARTWEDALVRLIEQAEGAGILVMRNGVVGNNTHRRLDPDEFRGFALVDDLAPLVFVNAADTKSGQMFTVAHELVHVFTRREGLSKASPRTLPREASERWCNQVAAELLVPLQDFVLAYRPAADRAKELSRLARLFKVSTLVILRRMHDAAGISREDFWNTYDAELRRLQALAPRSPGGDFHRTEAVRVSRRFARALITSTLEGQTLYRDAFRLLGIAKESTFKDFGFSLGVAV
jgi:Zn-dependent peptidase ImmA (M78 family)/transcriptional regulator with XRE-family HTH domain